MMSDDSGQCSSRPLNSTEEFECPLCLKLLYEPVTTPCGHTFCRGCLARALDHGQACPLCRTIMHLASEPPVTVVLQKIIERNFPVEYSQRKEEMHEILPHDVTWNLPLFPLKHVAFPGMTFPLHIFEPKYRLMVRRCMAGSRCFGIVNVHMSPNGSWVPYNVGCMIAISKTTILMDGRSIIHCKGLKRFRITQKWDQDGYLVGKVECFNDDPIEVDDADEYLRNARYAREVVNDIIRNEGRLEGLQKLLAQAGDIPIDDVRFSFWMSSLLPISPEHKQELLETTSTHWRFTRLLYIIERVRQVLDGDTNGLQAAIPGFPPTGFNHNTNNNLARSGNNNNYNYNNGRMTSRSRPRNGDGDGSDGQSGADGDGTIQGDGADGDGVGSNHRQGGDVLLGNAFAGIGQTFDPRQAHGSHGNGSSAAYSHNNMQQGDGQASPDGSRPQFRGIGQSRVGSGSCYAS